MNVGTIIRPFARAIESARHGCGAACVHAEASCPGDAIRRSKIMDMCGAVAEKVAAAEEEEEAANSQ